MLELELVEVVSRYPGMTIYQQLRNNSTQTRPSTDEEQNMIARVESYIRWKRWRQER